VLGVIVFRFVVLLRLPPANLVMPQGVQRMTKLLSRRRWKMYKKILTDEGMATKRELLLAQDASYNGARSVLQVLTHLLGRASWTNCIALRAA